MLKSQQPAVIPKIARYPSKRSYHFSQMHPINVECPLQQFEITHLISLASAQSKQLSYDSCDSYFMIVVTVFHDSWDNFFMIVVTAFPDSWDSFFKIAVIADPAA